MGGGDYVLVYPVFDCAAESYFGPGSCIYLFLKELNGNRNLGGPCEGEGVGHGDSNFHALYLQKKKKVV